MSATIPTTEPTQIRAGETLTFKRSIASYTAPDWTLYYYLRGYQLDAIDFNSTNSSGDHLVSVPFTTTANWKPGLYDAVCVASSSTERFQIWAGKIEVLPDFAAQGANFDARTQNRRTLDNINAVLEGRASQTVLNSEVNGTKLEKIPHKDLLELRRYFQQEVLSEERRAGGGRSKTIYAQFTIPR